MRHSPTYAPIYADLKKLEEKWASGLASADCPPVPGLAALSDQESKTIGDLVHALTNVSFAVGGQTSRSSSSVLLELLDEFPACIAVWLARKAGEAYDSGAFWEKFCQLIRVNIGMHERRLLAERFLSASRKTMADWVPPVELGGHDIVAQFLHQAGLPLDRCAGFAEHVRKVERSLGLPDADDPDAGDQLRDDVLESMLPINVPTLKRALRGPAGPRVCEIALRVVGNREFAGVNPLLGQALQRAFESVAPAELRRSARQPYLRLSEDLCSLEIVGPRQDPSLVGSSGLTWIVDGRRYPTPLADDFVFPVTGDARLVVELLGVGRDRALRAFAVRLDDLDEPFMVFEEHSRKQRRTFSQLPPGSYWLLHRTSYQPSSAAMTFEWPNSDRSVSLVEILPGTPVELGSSRGKLWTLRAVETPYFETVAKTIAHQGNEPVYTTWDELPFVWLPRAEKETVGEWRVQLRASGIDRVWPLSPTNDETGLMFKCRVGSEDLKSVLASGMHLVELELRRGSRTRPDLRAEYWVWQGLLGYGSSEFSLESEPRNLVQDRCRGFEFNPRLIRHVWDKYRVHWLAFDQGSTVKTFEWSRPGVFLESIERRPGQQSNPREHMLGEGFTASLNSPRWLRIWIVGRGDWEIVVDGRVWQHATEPVAPEFVNISLASLAITCPQGGDVSLRLKGGDLLLARFTSPLQPVFLERTEKGGFTGLTFDFTEPVTWARPTLRDLASGRTYSFEGQCVRELGSYDFAINEIPDLTIQLTTEACLEGTSLAPVTMLVPCDGWPDGFWFVELETRRDGEPEWQCVLLREKRAPVVIRHEATAAKGQRESLFWSSLASDRSPCPVLDLDDDGCRELFLLLQEVIHLRQGRWIDEMRGELGHLKDAVRALSHLAGGLAKGHKALQSELLNLACQDAKHSGFVYLPGLLALPGVEYRELPGEVPLNDALRSCAKVATADSISDLVRQDFDFFDFNSLSCFANFSQVANASGDEALVHDFERFDHKRYWEGVIGLIQPNRLAPDWDGQHLLGKDHLVWALEEFVRRYGETSATGQLGAANALLHSATGLREWLEKRLASKLVMAVEVWRAPWPRVEDADADFLQSTPRFASLFALTARAAAAGWLEFDEAMTWLQSRVQRRSMAEEGIAALVQVAPELFGHQLLFWEIIVRTTAPFNAVR